MRNNKQEIKDRDEIDAIIRQSQVCRLGLCDRDEPYIVPMCFGYDGRTLFFHCASEGLKLEILHKNPNVCFEFDIIEGLEEAKSACAFGMGYKSVIGMGCAHFIQTLEDKKKALTVIKSQYTHEDFDLPDKAVEHTCLFQVEIKHITGKQSD